MNTTIAFIGGGNMARSLIGGLIANGHPAASIWVADPVTAQLQHLQQHYGVHTDIDNQAVLRQADVVVLAVKPQMLREVANALAADMQHRQPLIISIAAGVREPDLRGWLGGDVALVRCMPNTPALLQCGATALYANARVNAQQRHLADTILSAAGITVWVDDEALLDSVTALSGSGPAYFFLVMEALEQVGQKLGLNAAQARQLTLQTALGAARMAVEGADDPATLRANVTSPGGTTERAIDILQQGGLEALFEKALRGAHARCAELSDLLRGQA